MASEEPDYTTYSLAELRDAQRNINRLEFPDRAARLDTEIASRPIARPNADATSSSTSGCAQYAVAFGSFVPLAGILAAIVAIALAFVGPRNRRKATIAIALGGVLFNVLLYGGLFYFALYRPIGPYRTMRDDLARDQLAQLVRDVEYYKVQTSHYPRDLEELKALMPNTTIYDMSRIPGRLQPFYFQLRDGGTSYYLFSVGPDGQPFTADDLQPRIPKEQRTRIGLRIPSGARDN